MFNRFADELVVAAGADLLLRQALDTSASTSGKREQSAVLLSLSASICVICGFLSLSSVTSRQIRRRQ